MSEIDEEVLRAHAISTDCQRAPRSDLREPSYRPASTPRPEGQRIMHLGRGRTKKNARMRGCRCWFEGYVSQLYTASARLGSSAPASRRIFQKASWTQTIPHTSYSERGTCARHSPCPQENATGPPTRKLTRKLCHASGQL